MAADGDGDGERLGEGTLVGFLLSLSKVDLYLCIGCGREVSILSVHYYGVWRYERMWIWTMRGAPFLGPGRL